jgi:hypothetical protein
MSEPIFDNVMDELKEHVRIIREKQAKIWEPKSAEMFVFWLNNLLSRIEEL